MIPYERRLQIAELLEQNEVVSLDEFCKSLGGVSESTVRRDLKTMEKEGEITLLYWWRVLKRQVRMSNRRKELLRLQQVL